jgi:hypothetical protein
MRCAISDLRVEAARGERTSRSFEVGAVSRPLEIEIRWTGVGESERHARGS